MEDQEKLLRTKHWVEKLAQGINPLTDLPVPEEDTINQVEIARCLFYVSHVLDQVLLHGIGAATTSGKKAPFYLTPAQRDAFEFSHIPIPLSHITARLNARIDNNQMKTISHRDISNWLVEAGFLEIRQTASAQMRRYPTQQGFSMGITVEERNSARGPYQVNLYSLSMQHLLLDNLDGILSLKKQK